MNNSINVVLASDNSYAQHMAVAMASVLKNTCQPEKIHFVVIDDGIQKENRKKILQTVENLHGHVNFLETDNHQLKTCFVSGQLSRTCYCRLDIPNLVNNEIKKVIYLDADLLVYDDIQEIWDMDLEGYPIAAVADLGIMTSKRIRKQKKQFIGLDDNSAYFNSGVLVMDLTLWRQENYAEAAIRLATQNEFPNHDQDALNKIFLNNWKELPLRWNVIPPVFNLFTKVLRNREYRNQAIAAKRNPSIFHYAGGYKPWEYKKIEGFNDYYYETLKDTAFSDVKMPQFDNRKKNRSISRQIFRLRLADLWATLFN